MLKQITQFFFQTTSYPPTYSKYERKICMQKCENDVETLIIKVTLKMIEKEIFFLTKKMRF